MWEKFSSIMIEKGSLLSVLLGLRTTLLIALCALSISTVLGGVLALFKGSGNRALRAIANLYTTVIRGVPMATLLMIFYFVLFTPLGFNNAVAVAIIAFGINSAAYCCEIFRAAIEGVNPGQNEAARSLGLNKRDTFIYIILPQAARTALPTYLSEFITLIKETSVASFIAVTDLQKACDNIRNRTYNAWIPLLSCAVIYLIVTIGLTKIFSIFENHLKKSDR